jgi:transcriptional regulator with XRE-family HTH domain
MIMQDRKPFEGQSYDELREQLASERPDIREALERTKFNRALATALVAMRKRRGIGQKELADIADWDKSFVSRLESANGGLPKLDTLMRYAEICGAKLQLRFSGQDIEERVNVPTTEARSAQDSSLSESWSDLPYVVGAFGEHVAEESSPSEVPPVKAGMAAEEKLLRAIFGEN